LIPQATEYAQTAAEKAKDFVDAKFIWASLIFQPYLDGEIKEVPDADRKVVSDACEALRISIDRTQHGSSADFRARLYASLSMGELLLGNARAADNAIHWAIKLAPGDEEIRRHYAFSLARQNRTDEAIALLGNDIEAKNSQIQLTWAQMRAQRGTKQDEEAAFEILSKNVNKLGDQSPQFRASWIDTLTKLYINRKDAAGALKLLRKEEIQKHLPSGRRFALLGIAELAAGNRIKAVEYAKESYSRIKDTEQQDIEELAILLTRVGEEASALECWKLITDVTSPIPQIHDVMVLAIRADDQEYVLKLGHKIRAKGVYEKSLAIG
jgi:tetratricopeptide (TPR) repeat protein